MADETKVEKKKEIQLTRFDVTIPYYVKDSKELMYQDWEAVYRKLDSWCNKFVFQLEKSSPTDKNPDGYIHWQCRINLVKKKTLASAVKELGEAIGAHVSPTSTNVHINAKSFNYVMKEDTRLEGPWTDEIKLDPPPVMTRQ